MTHETAHSMAVFLRLTLILAFAGILCSACETYKEQPGYGVSKGVEESCGLKKEKLTGNLAADLVGGWSQSSGGSHPLTTLGAISQVLVFGPDGSGQIWWTHEEPGALEGGYLDFTWSVEGGHLIVNDLPPAEVTDNGAGSVRVQEIGGEPADATAWRRCGDDLEVPSR